MSKKTKELPPQNLTGINLIKVSKTFLSVKSIIPPCRGRTKKNLQNENKQHLTIENSVGIVLQSKETLQPCFKELLSKQAIVARVANTTLKNSTINRFALIANYDLIRNKTEATIPSFKSFNQYIRIKEGFYLPNNARDNNFTPTKTRKTNFSIN
ncbi:MAG: hypothetical protein ABJH82_03270 [Polaribacter sp.]|uniref:hypothetical protein n=1 Tax=Polaribacter sp. TaxID=1920175 RepID=UPI0032632681